ncbi:RNA polymerase sigma factor [Saprospira grandis]|uniref:RNA polymerase sigma factor n=1 Tax=Saprospira grandis TaxID=1008 RepID=UPI0022DE29DB|nr:sigma-70 family RNA polymerase sigma factor [Saprospira grandis]WBM75073.1 sigma-70 family RNA polymerase sigma factor [Saprospira grandis]
MEQDRLILRLRKGDKAAMELLYERYSGILYGTILKIVKSEPLAQDVLQEVIVKVWQNIDRYDAQKGRLLTWMLRIARNRSIDVYRSNAYKHQYHKTNSLEQGVEIGKTELNVNTIGLKEIVKQLPEDYRKVIELAYFGGYTQVEIAEELNIPLGTVKSRVRIGLRELRKLVN